MHECVSNGPAEVIFDDVLLLCETVLNWKPFPYQEGLLRDQSRRIVACAGRQIGKSTTIAAKAIHFALTRPGTTTLIVSATLRQSMLMFEKVLDFMEAGPLRRSIAHRTKTKIGLTNGSRIIALPCGRFGSTLRGHTASLAILDEAAFMPEEVITNVVLPMISTTDGSVWMLSTPWDRSHIFYRAFASSDWSRYHLPSSVCPLISSAFLDEQKSLIGEERFALEYLAEFVEDSRSYFPMNLIRPCIDDGPEESNPVQAASIPERFAGYDPGGRESQAALAVVERRRKGLRVALTRAEKGRSYTEFNQYVAEVVSSMKARHLLVDETGLGEPILEHLRELNLPVDGLRITSSSKEQLLSNLKILMEEKRIALPHDLGLLNALNCIEYERGRNGGYTFSHRRGTFDDLAYALALACWSVRSHRDSGVIVKA